ncbi:MAG: 4-hydroxythreonine-4-phosphate dehydrogenase PdxA [Betaproteobacteria bacterium]|nr:4-hydroxythreonine-4-phosphate dehydrogenase PdxA [Betaproteobacteria bacterium]
MATNRIPLIAVTSGEPAGIGPDVCLDLAGAASGARLLVIGNRGLFEQRARKLGKSVSLREYRSNRAVAAGDNAAGDIAAGEIELLDLPLGGDCSMGHLNAANSPYVLEMIDRAYDGCVAGEFDAMVTAPVSKAAINNAGIVFTGHTEYLAQRAGDAHVVMMLVGGGLRVALATTHLALNDVSRALTQASLDRTLRVLVAGLRADFGLYAPRILVSGLNPHAGEDGYLGLEEIDVIRPVLNRLREEGMDLSGPLPADTLFNPARLRDADCVLAMYHDQGLPVLKFASFGAGVNVTLGLPVIRTSVDHGTALDIAGTGKADSGSLIEAIQLATAMIDARARHVLARA